MFESFYGLKHQPFGMTPDPKYTFWTSSYQEAASSLHRGIQSGRGFTALIAPPGMGKTTLLFHLLERLRDTARTAYVFQTQCSMREFFRCLMADLGLDAGEQDMVVLYAKLYELLIAETKAGKKFVLIVDEAQNLDDSVLETVRLLSNFETPSHKLMNVILAGQLQLSTKLARPELLQLRQRISIMVRLKPLVPWEVREYVKHRLKVAGYDGAPLFTAGALELIASASMGIPRVINNLCFNAMSLGYERQMKEIGAAIIQQVISDLELEMPVTPAAASNSQIKQRGLPHPAALSRKYVLERLLRPAVGFMANHRNLSIAALVVFLCMAAYMTISLLVRKSSTAGANSGQSAGQFAPAKADGPDFFALKAWLNGADLPPLMTVIVGRDENLDFITRKYLGRSLTPRVKKRILELNPLIRDPAKLRVDDRVHLPLSEARITSLSQSLAPRDKL